MLMYYIDCYSFFEHPEKDWLKLLDTHDPPPAEPSLFDYGGLLFEKEIRNAY